MKKRKLIFVFAALLAVLTVTAGFFIFYGGSAYAEEKKEPKAAGSADKKGQDAPVTVGSAEKFDELMKEFMEKQQEYHLYTDDKMAFEIAEDSGAARNSIAPSMPSGTSAPAAGTGVAESIADANMIAGPTGGEAGHSTTNVQVQGVDEADIIKTDGNYIYHLTNGDLHIIKADGKGKIEKITTVKNEGEEFYPSDMYVDKNTLCLIGYSSARPDKDTKEAYNSFIWRHYTRVQVYHISDRSKPKKTRDFHIEGSLISSRKVDDTLYLAVNHYMNFYNAKQPRDVVPLYNDSLTGSKEFVPVGFDRMIYFPGHEGNTLLIVCGIDLADNKTPAEIESLLGSGSTVYMSRTALYIARTDYDYQLMSFDWGIGGRSAEKTTFLKFTLEKGKAAYKTKATEDGQLLNQYSMDEYEGYFRAALTVGSRRDDSKNALVIFDSQMKQTGKISDMAPGERIYSARFMGDRAFMVTFRETDPLFAMDLSDPRNPKVLGELKIPGFSTYLHPYDEDHLIGFGQNTEEYTTTNSKGEIINQWVAPSGLKLALFDISDMTKPREVDSVVIGNQNTYSDFLYNPKAMLFSHEKGFIAFPVTHFNWGGDQRQGEPFAGAHVYNISKKGFSLRGKISMTDAKTGDVWDQQIQRMIWIGDSFYSVSYRGIQSNKIQNLEYIASVKY